MTGYVFDIQHFSLKDGPGIRTTVFVKGCPLNCVWCHNPESKRNKQELSFDKMKCIDCGYCASVCSDGAILSPGEIDRTKCSLCGECVNNCVGALEILGKEVDTEEIISEILRDKAFYDNSGGGLTISGGEPLYCVEFTKNLLKSAKEQSIHTAVETSGFADFEDFELILPYVDLFLFDVKETNSALHKEYTGVDNRLILENLHKLNENKASIVLRCPIIPGYNDREEHFKAIAELSEELDGVLRIELMPYHSLGKSKARLIGREYSIESAAPTKEQIQNWIKAISDFTSKKVIKA